MKYKSLMPALFFSLLLYVSVFAQSTLSGTITKNANLRAGPATTYAVVGTVKQGQTVTIIGKNDAGTWYHLDGGQWIATFLVKVATDTPSNNPTAPATATAKAQPNQTATPVPVATSTTAPTANASIVAIGQELKGKGWRFKVKEIHKRKAVYWGNDSYVAMGHFLVVIIDAVNEQSGTDYFAHNIDPYLVDDPGHAYAQSGTGTIYATWQYEGISTIYTDVNPGNLVRIAMAFDLPDSTGHVLLSTALPGWVELGNFAGMKSEDN